SGVSFLLKPLNEIPAPLPLCQTCPKDWIQFQESCYFFYNLNSPWKPWDESRQLCQNMKSDLVVISSLEEQTFIKDTIKYYLDIWHGYWIGLQKVNNNWIWVDGSPDTLDIKSQNISFQMSAALDCCMTQL
uniref:C-type lectin domain-containing protein n=1 Tax=Oryzias sinensis TaxID=183150 RepID=A0A8C7WWI3_9TELE